MSGGTPVGDALVARIASRVAAAGGWMPFDDFMAEALYAPGLGYYSGGRRIFGLGPESGSDFVTAPELSPFFGRTLSVQVREALTAAGSDQVFEFGGVEAEFVHQATQHLGGEVVGADIDQRAFFREMKGGTGVTGDHDGGHDETPAVLKDD